MCDYSLMSLPNRLAVCGEELVVHRFELGVIGLMSASELQTPIIEQAPARGFIEKLKRSLFPPPARPCTAVCIPPGARLFLRDIPNRVQQDLELHSSEQQVVFTQIGTVGFRDAVRFENGIELLLQHLTEGQRVQVLALSNEEYERDAHRARLRVLASSTAGL